MVAQMNFGHWQGLAYLSLKSKMRKDQQYEEWRRDKHLYAVKRVKQHHEQEAWADYGGTC